MKSILSENVLAKLSLESMIMSKIFILMLIALFLTFAWGCKQGETTRKENGGMEKKSVKQKTNEITGGTTMVVMSTSIGDIKIELYENEAPITVENFLTYVRDGFYDGTIFHRVIPGFMIQGGGFTQDMNQKPTKAPIKNEADNGLGNETGTLAMARTVEVNSATSQFFINLTNNDFLNHGYRDFGYAVFGKVVEGMDVVNKIAQVQTGNKGPHQNVPVKPVVIESVRVVEE
jgi:peptidyl-prolyl cis-trans isomerase A (cyclophilin A)